jgi:hypothetical protein
MESPATIGPRSAGYGRIRQGAARTGRILWICFYALVLLLAIRWCARTYPGWYVPASASLNDLLNGVGLFTALGYKIVLLAAAAAMAREVLPRAGRAAAVLRAVQWTSVALAALIVCYGVCWAVWTHRLPWQEDGSYRLRETLDLL